MVAFVLDVVVPANHTFAVHSVPVCTQAAAVIVGSVVVLVVLVKLVDQLTVVVDTEDGQQVVLVLHEAEPLDEKIETLDVVVNKDSLMGSLAKGLLTSSLVKTGIPVRDSLMGSLVGGPGDSCVMDNTSAVHLVVHVNYVASMMEEGNAREVGM